MARNLDRMNSVIISISFILISFIPLHVKGQDIRMPLASNCMINVYLRKEKKRLKVRIKRKSYCHFANGASLKSVWTLHLDSKIPNCDRVAF